MIADFFVSSVQISELIHTLEQSLIKGGNKIVHGRWKCHISIHYWLGVTRDNITSCQCGVWVSCYKSDVTKSLLTVGVPSQGSLQGSLLRYYWHNTLQSTVIKAGAVWWHADIPLPLTTQHWLHISKWSYSFTATDYRQALSTASLYKWSPNFCLKIFPLYKLNHSFQHWRDNTTITNGTFYWIMMTNLDNDRLLFRFYYF